MIQQDRFWSKRRFQLLKPFHLDLGKSPVVPPIFLLLKSSKLSWGKTLLVILHHNVVSQPVPLAVIAFLLFLLVYLIYALNMALWRLGIYPALSASELIGVLWPDPHLSSLMIYVIANVYRALFMIAVHEILLHYYWVLLLRPLFYLSIGGGSYYPSL